MKATRLTMIIAAFFAVIFCAVPGQAQFAGKIDYVLSAEGKEIAVSYSESGDNIRFDLAKGVGPIPGGMSAIINMEEKQGFFLMKEMKMAVVAPMNKFSELGKDLSSNMNQKDEDKADLKKTGKTKSIAGYSCEQWLMTVKDKKKGGNIEIWTAKNLGGISFFSDMLKGAPQWATKLAQVVGKNGGLPLLVIAKNEKDKEVFRVEAKDIMVGKPDASTFQVPAGYQIIDSGKMQVEPDVKEFDTQNKDVEIEVE